jgi:hypothetical protein
MNEQQILLEAIGQSCKAGQERDTLLEKALAIEPRYQKSELKTKK